MRPMADRLSPFMRELCRMETLGGRCTRLNNDKWEINDVAEWTEAQTVRLRARFPAIEPRVVTNRQSLNGFTIMLERQRAPHIWVSLAMVAMIVAALAAMAQTTRHH